MVHVGNLPLGVRVDFVCPTSSVVQVVVVLVVMEGNFVGIVVGTVVVVVDTGTAVAVVAFAAVGMDPSGLVFGSYVYC